MFDRIAGVYDLMNSAMTAGMHHRWRARAVDRAGVGPGDAALDVCCGTGDLTLELARRVGPAGRVVGSDFSERMLDLAREKPVPAGGREADLRVGGRARAALRRRRLRRRHGRLRGPQPRRPRSRDRRDDPGAEARRAARHPRDHPADPAAALDLLLDLVRPARAADRPRSPATATPTATCRSRSSASRRRSGLGEIMDGAGLERNPLDDPRRRDHRDPLGRRPG